MVQLRDDRAVGGGGGGGEIQRAREREREREKVLFFQSDELRAKKADQAFTMRTLPDSLKG